MSEIAPLPWRWAVGNAYNSETYVFSGDEEVCTVHDDGHDMALDDQANAAFIVKAVNAHDDLVAALKSMVAVANKQGSRWREKLPDGQSPLGLALAALAKAEASSDA